jgi:hypothetical protein
MSCGLSGTEGSGKAILEDQIDIVMSQNTIDDFFSGAKLYEVRRQIAVVHNLSI